jgi:hypothetical protein
MDKVDNEQPNFTISSSWHSEELRLRWGHPRVQNRAVAEEVRQVRRSRAQLTKGPKSRYVYPI